MNKEEYLFQVISEEAAEVSQAVSKILRFGKENSNPVRVGGTNEDDLLEEFYQMQAMIEHMQRNNLLKTPSESEIDKIKKRKLVNVYRYMDESRRVGTLIDDETPVIQEKALAYDKLSEEYDKLSLHDDGSEARVFACTACDVFVDTEAKIEAVRKAMVSDNE